MFAGRNSHKILLNVMLAIALLAVAIPTCQMIGCDMGMCGGMMMLIPHSGPSLAADCGGAWIANAGQLGVFPPELITALVAMLAMLGLAAFVLPPRRELQPIRVETANPPPDPIPPQGERFRV